jgi:hypothetical protein
MASVTDNLLDAFRARVQFLENSRDCNMHVLIELLGRLSNARIPPKYLQDYIHQAVMLLLVDEASLCTMLQETLSKLMHDQDPFLREQLMFKVTLLRTALQNLESPRDEHCNVLHASSPNTVGH